MWHAVLVGQQTLAGLLHAQHITDTYSGHYIHLTQPQLVINWSATSTTRSRRSPTPGSHAHGVTRVTGLNGGRALVFERVEPADAP